MEKSFQPQEIEATCYQQWENQDYFSPSGSGEPYAIMLPPPNVTGTLHVGHAFQHTLMDILIRFHRMKGNNTLWQPGTDHAGIATQMVVERRLNAVGQDRLNLGRDAFLEEVWAWKKQSGDTISKQMRRLGSSCDWSRERFTMDEGMSNAVSEVFISLYEQGLIYRGKRLVNWDPVFRTAVSDLEVLSEEENGHMWHFKYPIAGDDGQATNEFLEVATTRPETLLGDTAVAVNPDDERFNHLIGQFVLLPLASRLIPIVGDEHADPEKGTGCVKITPAHDFNDYGVGMRHNLPMINVFTEDACMNGNVPEKYQGLDRFEARKQVVSDMTLLGLLEGVKDHRFAVPRGDRSGAVIEPYLTDQWYVDLTRDALPDGRPGGKQKITQPSIDAVESGRIEFVPGNWAKTYYQWMYNIEDWCISRQLWWGHRIPAWYDEQGQVYVGRDEAALREKHNLADDIALKQDEDVLDTWFSSALWPFSTLGWPEQTEALKTWYPTNVLVTGFDIIFFWVARMIMFGEAFAQDIPFKQVYITGLVRDADGQKMSKSKGNTLDPLDIIDGIDLEALVEKRTSGMMQDHLAEKIARATRKQFPAGIPAYGTDALRFTFAALASTGRDVRLDLNRVEGYRNFCNKLWNAARFVLMQCENQDCGLNERDSIKCSMADRWIMAEFHQVTAIVTEYIHQYRFDMASKALYEFVWHEFCDWYLELAKTQLQQAEMPEAEQRGTRYTLVNVCEGILRLAHPFMPFITESIWGHLKPLTNLTEESLMLRPYPEQDPHWSDEEATKKLVWLKSYVNAVRKIRSEMDINPGKKLPVMMQFASETDRQSVQELGFALKVLAKLDSMDFIDDDFEPPESAAAVLGDMTLLIPLADLIDKSAEIERLTKVVDKLQVELTSLKKRLGNGDFVARAKPEVVEKTRQQLADKSAELTHLSEQLDKIRSL